MNKGILMQLPNFELSDRIQQAFESHGIAESMIPLFMKSCFHTHSMYNPSNTEAPTITTATLMHYLEDCFELSAAWLNGVSEKIFEINFSDDPLEALLETLILAKQKGQNPHILFVKSSNASLNDILMFIELSKITETSIAYKSYKRCAVNSFEIVLQLCNAARLFYQGLIVDDLDFQGLQAQTIIPAVAIKNAKKLWYPKTTENSLVTSTKLNSLINILTTTALTPRFVTTHALS